MLYLKEKCSFQAEVGVMCCEWLRKMKVYATSGEALGCWRCFGRIEMVLGSESGKSLLYIQGSVVL